MEFKDDSQWEYQPAQDPAAGPDPESEHTEQAAPSQEGQPVYEQAPIPEAEPYRGSGTGRRESPFADSPYETHWAEQPQPEPAPDIPPQTPKKARRSGKVWFRVLAASLVLVLIAASCSITALLVNNRWEKETQAMNHSFAQQIAALEDRLEAAADSGDSISGSPVSSGEGLTPSQVYASNKRSVVAITSTAYTNSYGGTYESTSSGSGFILTEDGYVVTNYHVVEGASKLTITTFDGQEYEATLKGYDSTNDLAVLKVETTGLQAVTIGSSDDLVIGDMVVAIGNPLGELTSTQTVGYVSGKDRNVSTDGTVINMLQTDAAINPGNSGGPLFNMKGEVVGITTAKYSGTTNSGASIEGIGFAIPIDDVSGMISDIVNFGYVTGAYLGVYVSDMDEETANYFGLPIGAYVREVTPGYAAEAAGLKVKDIIVKLGDTEISNRTDLTRALRKFKAGDTTTITVYRGGQELQLSITLSEKPNDTTSTTPDETNPMPSGGDYDEWYKYFFGNGRNGG